MRSSPKIDGVQGSSTRVAEGQRICYPTVPSPSPIFTNFVFPPIPERRSDWCATRDNYEPGCNIGWGRTEQDAIDDLLQIEWEKE